MNVALILAGGLGLRMKRPEEPPKQFFMLGEKPVLIHTLERFEKHPEIGAICVVCLPPWRERLWEMTAEFGISKVRWVVASGDCRQDSVFNGLSALENECAPEDMVLVHDGVRPFITLEIISENIQTALKFGNAMTGMRSTDTLIRSVDGNVAEIAMERNNTFTVQTPQTYRLGYGLKLYKQAYKSGRTQRINCCELFIESGEKVYIVNGRKSNIKLTTRDDIAYLEYLNKIFSEYNEIAEADG